MIVGGMLFVYVASVGPVAAYSLNHTGRDQRPQTTDTLRAVYSSLVYVGNVAPPIGILIDRYIDLFEHLMPRRRET